MPKKPETFESAQWTIEIDDETGKPFWEGASAGDMDSSRFDYGEPLIMNPEHFPPGTIVNVTEPWDEEFYRKLAEDQDKAREVAAPVRSERKDHMHPSLPQQALGFARCAHRKQRRKYTGEPYVVHCESVSRIVAEYTNDLDMIAAACLHDVVEDTDVTPDEIREVFGERVAQLVSELTDVSRPTDGNRRARKKIDREHTAQSSVEGATIKLADLIDNTGSIVEHDKGFARSYLEEKELLLEVLKHGNPDLWQRAYATLQEGQLALIHASLQKGES